MPLSWLSCLRFTARRPARVPPALSSRRNSNRRGTRNTFKPAVMALEDRTVPSGFGFFRGFGEFGGFGGFTGFGGYGGSEGFGGSSSAPAAHLQVIVPEAVQAGQTFDVVVEALTASNQVATGFTDTVSLSSTDKTATGSATSGGTLTGLPLTYTFTSQDHGVHVFQVTMTTTGSESVTATDTATGTTVTSGTASTVVNPAPTLTQLLVVTPQSAAVGVPTNVTVVAEDASGHVLHNFTGTVSLSTSDSAATGLPSTYTFTSSDRGVHTFQVTFETADTTPTGSTTPTPTTVTATDGSITDTASITVQPATTVTHFAVVARRPVVSGTATQVVVAALNASNQVVTGYTGTVSLSSSTDSTATASATSGGTQTPLSSFTYQFTAGDAGVHTFYVAFDTTGAQKLTVSDSSSGVSNTANVNVLATAPQHKWWGWWF